MNNNFDEYQIFGKNIFLGFYLFELPFLIKDWTKRLNNLGKYFILYCSRLVTGQGVSLERLMGLTIFIVDYITNRLTLVKKRLSGEKKGAEDWSLKTAICHLSHWRHV